MSVSMDLYPAIDLKDGQCVRLLRGEMDQATVFNDDPGAQARAFVDAGSRWIHVVDLNGAFEGHPVNAGPVEAILASVKDSGKEVRVQLGGGIRTESSIEAWLERGIERVILGTAALRDPDLVINSCRRWPGRVAVGIDARKGFVAVQGWAEVSQITALDLAKRFENAGVAAIIHTDIDRDGVLQGPNVAFSAALARQISTPVIVSGGVSELADIKAVRAEGDSGLSGVIVGRAIYDGRVDVAAAIRVLSGEG